ncbi:MAG: rhodanese-like domain-containing protein [Rhodocyclaceae bacterium]|nr:rhodanese-like domain-containing protein [Rhodocyclaceae bacterium]
MKHLTPRETHAFLERTPQALFIDCRSTIEYYFVGHPVGAIHVAWNDGEDWETNPDFVDEVTRLADGDRRRPVALICRSGRRTVEAGEALEAAGFAEVINVLHGFEGERDENMHRNTLNGWRVDGLPWEQS